MTLEDSDLSTTDATLARHRAFAEVLQGDRPMMWSDWASLIEDSQCLTPSGQSVARWAVDTLQRTLGSDFLQRAGAAPGAHPVFSLGFWPGANDVPWVYANLFQLAAQFELLTQSRSKDWGKVKQAISSNLEAVGWIHCLLQLELAGLGLRAGWQSRFEPKLDNGHLADVCLTREGNQLLVETVSMRMSTHEQEALAFFRTLAQQLSLLEMQYAVHISGSLGTPLSAEESRQWLQEIGSVARSVAQNGIIRLVSNQTGGRLEISREQPTLETTKLEGDPVTEDGWGRLVARLNDKARQAKGAGPVWVRLEEISGLWHFTPLQGMTLQEKLGVLLPDLQKELASFPDLAGVILAPAILWAGNAAPERLSARIEREGGIALRSPLPGYRVRESIIVTRAGQAREDARIFADWYEQEATWLDWALEQMGHPPFHTLVQEDPEESGR